MLEFFVAAEWFPGYINGAKEPTGPTHIDAPAGSRSEDRKKGFLVRLP